MKYSVPETSDEEEEEETIPKPKPNQKQKSKSKSKSHKLHSSTTTSIPRPSSSNTSNQYNGPFCKPLSVQLNQSTPSPFANPPNLSKSIYSSPLKSSSRSSHHRIQNISTSSSEEEEEDGEEEDSEEEKWPIRKQDPSRYQSTSYLVPDHDSLQVWDQEGRRSTYLISMKKTSERRKQFEEIHHKTIQRVNERQEAVYEEQMNELSKVLEQIELDQSREIRTIKEGFERRERDRLKVFDELIRKAEEIEKEETLRVFKIKQEEAEKKAREERQAEEERNRSEVQARLEKDQLRLKNELELRKKEVMEKKRIEKDLEDSLDRNQKDSLKENYMKWYRVIEQIKQTVLPNVSSNESFKTICRQAKRKITPKVGQLTNSSKQIQKVIIELGEVLQQTKQSDLNVYIWACNHLSKALIKQSETEVTAKPSTVYPLSRVVIGLILIGYPELGQVMMARIVKKCYFVTSHRPIKFETESDELYGKRLGYLVGGGRKNDEGLVQYSNRISGIFSLYCGICQVDINDIVPSLKNQIPSSKLSQIDSCFKVSSLWSLLVNLIKSDLANSLVLPKLISCLIEVSYQRMWEVYGTQWLKVLRVLLVEGIRKNKWTVSKEAGVKASLVQLESILEDLLERGILPACEGRLYED